MSLLPILMTLIVLSVGNSIHSNSDHQEYLEILFGKTLDISIVNDIVEEEANGLGITAEEHFNFCFLKDKGLKLRYKKDFDDGYPEFKKKIWNMTFDSADNVMEQLKENTPMIHSVFTWLFKEIIANLGRESSIFIVNLKDTLIDTLFKHINLVLSGKSNRRAPMYGKAIKKMYDDYDGLSVKAKVDLEKNSCFRTIYRIIDLTGDRKGSIAEMKRMFSNYIDAASFKP